MKGSPVFERFAVMLSPIPLLAGLKRNKHESRGFDIVRPVFPALAATRIVAFLPAPTNMRGRLPSGLQRGVAGRSNIRAIIL